MENKPRKRPRKRDQSKSPLKDSRNWAITDHTLKSREFYTEFHYRNNVSYLVLGKETCPTTGKEHWQGLVIFKNEKSVDTVRKALPGVHVERCRKSELANERYCKKDGDWIEIGLAPSGQGKRNDLKKIIDMVKTGISDKEICEDIELAPTWGRNYRALAEIRTMFEVERNWVTEVHYIYGEAGCGKSRLAYEAGATFVEVVGRRFINGYNGEDVVCFDDVDKDTFPSRGQLLKLMDRYPYKIDIKGGSRNWKPRVIYMTSNFPPEETFYSIPYDDAVKRRITKITHLQKIEENV